MDLTGILSRFADAMKNTRRATSGEVRAAIALVEDLREMPFERRAIVCENTARFQTIAVARRLLEVAHDEAGQSPESALGWLDTFEVLIETAGFDRDAFHQKMARELAVLGAVRRAQTMGKLGQLDEAMVLLRIVDQMDFASLETRGEWHEARAWIFSIRQQLPAALRELEEATKLYSSIQDSHLVARARAAVGFAYGEARQYEEAAAEIFAACRGIDPKRDRRLALAACFNLARNLHDAGRTQAAVEAMALAGPFFHRHAGRTDRAHWSWLQAGLLARSGDFESSMQLYRGVLAEFADLGLGIEASEAAIDAVESFARAGRAREILPLLVLATKVCEAEGFKLDGLAAWSALRDCVAREVVSAAVIAAARSAVSSA